MQCEQGPFPFTGLDGDVAAVRLRYVAHDCQAETGAAGLAAARAIDAVEALEDPGEVPLGNAHTVVADAQAGDDPLRVSGVLSDCPARWLGARLNPGQAR